MVRDVASLPVDDHLLTQIVEVRLPSLEQLARLDRELLQEVLTIDKICDSIDVVNVFLLSFVEDRLNVKCWVRQPLGSHNRF